MKWEVFVFGEIRSYRRQAIHNALIHPVLLLLPGRAADRLHDSNARWTFGSNRLDEMKLENPHTLAEVLTMADRWRQAAETNALLLCEALNEVERLKLLLKGKV